MNTKKLLGYALGPLGSAAVSAVSLPLISWYFPADDIGRIVLLQTVAGLVLIFAGLGLDQAYIREYHGSADRAGLFKSIFAVPLVLVAGLCILLALNLSWPSEKLFELPDAGLGVLCLLFFASSLICRYLSVILRMEERPFAFSFSQFTPKVLILLVVAVYFLTGSPNDTFRLVLAYTAAQLVTLAVLAFQTKGALKEAAAARFSGRTLKTALDYGFPLALGGLAYWGFASIDRFVLKQQSSLGELGVYSMAVSFGAIALIFQSIFSTIWAPMVFKWIEDNTNLDKIGGIAAVMTDMVAAILCAAGIFSPLVPLLLPEKYDPVQFILLSSILFPLLYTLTEVSGIGINVRRKTWLITLISLAAFGCNWFLLNWLVPLFGARGAAMATAASFWIFFLLKTEVSIRIWQPLPRGKLYGATAACLAVSLAYTHWGSTQNHPLFCALWLAVLVWLFRQHRNSLQKAVAAVKGRLKK
ncbi:hypothetical protein BG910_03020 [Neisseria chenwenguii]|uniref:Uncharacterized protein n=1 Tax=Neisseria chenwenguii TaxID=1853278 RepID=A0A220S044_9NEIS|nr:oligosaccharide flippase family protein [Neisseria chenwenguii]ASK26849.1 hypothetical protein BG910_03020 [Neisseria chenwenguii]